LSTDSYKYKGWTNCPAFDASLEKLLSFTNFEHLGAASWAGALSGGAKILHGDGLGILHFPLGATLDTITLNSSHGTPPLSLLARIDYS